MKKYFLLTIAVLLCALSIDAQYKMQVNLKNGQVSEFNVSDIENVTWQEQAEEWHDVGFYYDEQGNKVEGWAMLTDDYVTALFEVGNQIFPVRVQERADKPGLFRLVNAYSGNYPVNEPGEWHTDKDYYIIIDATNPNQVYIPDFCETGMEWSYGMFGIWSCAGYFMSKGYSDDDVRDYFGTYANGVITFPVDALLISLAEYEDGTLYYSNRNGLFKLVLNPDLESVKVTGITLNMSSLSLTEGDTYTLSATVFPSNATDKSVIWSSSNSSVATVSSTGKVTAINAGTATITATANDSSGVKATCSVTVKSLDMHNGHEYVDLGLPSGLKWATCNIGASSPEDYGGYYAWGETTTKSTYGWSNYKHGYKEEGALIHLTKYFGSDAKMVLESGDDVAHLMWGGNWRMPTSSEIKELLDNCTGTWCTQNGVNGYKVTSKKNGNSIFLPAAGYYLGNSLTSVGTEGDYWSSSLVSSNSIAAYSIIFNSSKWYMSSDLGMRYLGQSVRAVFSEFAPSTVKVAGITLDKSSLSLTEGDTYTLSATVSPSNATDKSVTWKSSNTSVATVSTSGKVSAVNAGTATITATANDGSGIKATCSVTVKSSEYEHNGHGYVDLGLPSGTKWATCNVGATKPEYYGEFYAFGETSTKSSYTTSNYKYGSNPNIPYNIQGTSYDVAHAKWGGNWVMPTFTQIKELVDNCTFVWTSVNGVYGGKFIGPNGNSIFMPAGGCYNSGKYINEGTYGCYWSSIMAYRQNWGECECFSFNSGKVFLYTTTITGTTRNNFSNGSDGKLVRPVMP